MPWITPDGSYYDGQGPVANGSTQCAIRPSTSYTLGALWQTNPLDPATCWRLKTQTEMDTEREAEISVKLDADKILRLIFEINYDQENRVRALEGKAAITKLTYRNALIATYKTL